MIKIDISDIYKPYTSAKCSVIYVKQHWNKYKIRYETQSKNIKYMVHLFVNMPKKITETLISILLTFYSCDTSTRQYTHTQDRDRTLHV